MRHLGDFIFMKHRIVSLLLAVSLCFALAGQSTAVELPAILANGEPLQLDAPVSVINQTTYVSYWPVVKTFYPEATAVWEDGRAVVRAEGLELKIQPGTNYMIANGNCLPLPDGVQVSGNILTVPVRPLCKALGVDVGWDGELNVVSLTDAGTGPIAPAAERYNADDLYWLTRIIYAESGNQPLEGQIAVGNVIMNRVKSPLFPNTVYDVIHQRNQFTPVRNGTINLTPDEEAEIAAKLVLEGVNTAWGSLYFINPRVSSRSWVARTRTHVTTIASHAFYY